MPPTTEPKLKAVVLLHNEEGAVRVLRKTVRLPLKGLVQVHGGGKGGGHGKGSGGAGAVAPSRRFSVKVIFEGQSLEKMREKEEEEKWHFRWPHCTGRCKSFDEAPAAQLAGAL